MTHSMPAGIKTTRKQVFDFDTAIRNGVAYDQHRDEHAIVAHGKQHLITEHDQIEYCFDASGRQFSSFPKVQLQFPSVTEIKLWPYLIYNTRTMTVVEMHQSSKGYGAAKRNDKWECINITHPASKKTLAALGIHQTTWLEPKGGQ
ncbi:hypothetical protein IC617_08510 [Neiella sp. HB171785]|uniref:Uncharacterized protein n=1 Tax=Neiella litorisoli TaxID=2771431 RepID=A0A8J6QU58_9GAMM|nr:hypothetical protein [Neiella litorisoli]MBD1389467.1 hypothetical protein [Neiella litorisoli]